MTAHTGSLPSGPDPEKPKRASGARVDEGRRLRTLAPRLGLEFAIVVFGVFSALWADAQVAARAERRVEAARLEALGAGIATTLTELREFVASLGDDRALIRAMLVPPAGSEDDDDRRSEAVATALLGGTSMFQPQLAVYDDLRSSGELSLLDPDVRTTLSAMDQRLRRLEDAQQDLTTVQQLNFDAFAMRNVDLVPILGDYLELDVAADPQAPGQYEAFLDSREFRNLVVFRLDLLTQVLTEARELEASLESASVAVEERLGRLR